MEKVQNDFYLINDEKKEISNFNDDFLLKGKSLYEVIRIIDGVPIFLSEHLARLNNSAMLMGVKLPLTEDEVKKRLKAMMNINNCSFGNIKIVFNYNGLNCDFYCYFLQHKYPEEKDYIGGVKTISYNGERENPNVKVMNINFRSSVDAQIKKAGAYEAILIDSVGNVTEGSKSNIFMVKGNDVITAPIKAVLPGITRGIVIDIVKSLGFTLCEQYVCFENISQMDGLFITGTSPKVLPINKVDDMQFSSSSNELICKIQNEYNNKIKSYILQNTSLKK